MYQPALPEPEQDEPVPARDGTPPPPPLHDELDHLCDELARDRRNTAALVRLTVAAHAHGAHRRLAEVLRVQLAEAPSSPDLWISLYQALAAAGDAEAARAALEDGLTRRAGLRLWMFYLRELRQRAADTNTMLGAYDRALADVGHDIDVGALHADLVDFVQRLPPDAALGEMARDALVRRTYVSLLGQPHSTYSETARRYEEWERGSQPGRYYAMPRELREQVERLTRVSGRLTELWRATPRVHYMPVSPADGAAAAHVQAWRRVFAAERDNPARLPADEHAARMQYVWSEYVRQMFYYDSAWDEYAKWTRGERGVAAAAAVYRAALQVRPDAALLRHELAQMLERAGQRADAAQVYEEWLRDRPSALAWCLRLQYCARTGATGDVRREFLAAMHSPACDWTVYTTMAHIELFVHREPRIAIKICERAMPAHQANIDFVMAYLDMCTFCGDTADAVSVYERALGAITDAATRRRLLGRYLRYARVTCNTARITDIEQRIVAEQRGVPALDTLLAVAGGVLHGASLVSADEARAIESGGTLAALAPRMPAPKRPAPPDSEPQRKRAAPPVSTENSGGERPTDDVFARRAAQKAAAPLAPRNARP